MPTLRTRAWAETACDRHDSARALIRPILDGWAAALLPTSVIDARLPDALIAATAGDPFAARRALQIALAATEPLDALRPFVQAGPGEGRASGHCSRTTTAASEPPTTSPTAPSPPDRDERTSKPSSARELNVLEMLPSLLSINEIADDLTVSVNTVKSHIRSIYTQLGVGSRRSALLTDHEHGLLSGVH